MEGCGPLRGGKQGPPEFTESNGNSRAGRFDSSHFSPASGDKKPFTMALTVTELGITVREG